MKLITMAEAAKILGVSRNVLEQYETPDGRWALIFGQRLRVWYVYRGVQRQRRYSQQEVERLAWRVQYGP